MYCGQQLIVVAAAAAAAAAAVVVVVVVGAGLVDSKLVGNVEKSQSLLVPRRVEIAQRFDVVIIGMGRV